MISRLSASLLALAVLPACDQFDADSVSARAALPSYAIDAAGKPAEVLNSWPINFQESEKLGSVSSASVCGEHAYLADPRQNTIHDISLPEGRLVGEFTWLKEFGHPLVTDARCDANALVVTGETGALFFSTKDRTLTRKFSFPSGFVAARGTVSFDPASNMLFVSGIWADPAEWRERELATILERDRVGLRLSVADGAAEPLLDRLVDQGCPVSSGNCFENLLIVNQAEATDKYFVAAKLSLRVGVYNVKGILTRSFSIVSPRFKAGREPKPKSGPLSATMKWMEGHSIIHGFYALQSRLAVAHGTQVPKENWKLGEWVEFEPYLNVYSLDGSGLISDVRLPDLPVGADLEGIYVVDYGAEGRRDDLRTIRLLRLRFPTGSEFAAK